MLIAAAAPQIPRSVRRLLQRGASRQRRHLAAARAGAIHVPQV